MLKESWNIHQVQRLYDEIQAKRKVGGYLCGSPGSGRGGLGGLRFGQ
jgi:hypothetical protein